LEKSDLEKDGNKVIDQSGNKSSKSMGASKDQTEKSALGGKKKKPTSGKVVIKRDQRGKRKFVTVITGLESYG